MEQKIKSFLDESEIQVLRDKANNCEPTLDVKGHTVIKGLKNIITAF
jgi:hypothetical protein